MCAQRPFVLQQWQVSSFEPHTKRFVGSGRCRRCPGPTGLLLQWHLQAFTGTAPLGGLGAAVVARWDADHTHRSLYRPDAFLPNCWLLLFLDQRGSPQHPISSRQRTLKTLAGQPAVEIQTNTELSSLCCSIPLSPYPSWLSHSLLISVCQDPPPAPHGCVTIVPPSLEDSVRTGETYQAQS